jgi:hypothetical protein
VFLPKSAALKVQVQHLQKGRIKRQARIYLRSKIDRPRPNPALIDAENPEWTEEDFAEAVPLSALPAELQTLLPSPKRLAPDAEPTSARQSAV